MATVLSLVSDKVRQGFTLLELMIAIAIIGILASIAIPAYNTYVYKTRVSELIAAASPSILAVNEFAIVKMLPAGPVTGYPASPAQTFPANSNINNITVDNAGIVKVTGNDKTKNTVITFTPTVDTSGNVNWTCTSGPTAENKKYAPASCP